VNSKRVISEFLVGDDREKEWLSKPSAIALAEAGRLHAIELLIDLRDLANRGDRREFLLKFDALKKRHSSKSSFIGRLRNFDLWESTANV